MIQLTRDGVVGFTAVSDLERQFGLEHTFRLPGLLHPDLIHLVSTRLADAIWTTRADGKIAKESLPDQLGPLSILNFVVNVPDFLNLIRRITHCDQIVSFGGRVYRMSPDTEHFDSWHNDLGSSGHRLVGMSINLGRPYDGGIFRLRDESSGVILSELPNTGPGDAIFFRVSSKLQHMVTPVEGSAPKTAFAGWFHSAEVDYYNSLRGIHGSR